MKIVKPPLDSFNQDQGQPIYIDFNLNANQTSGLRWKTTDPNDSEDTTLDVGFYLDDDDDHLQIFDYRNGRALQEWYTNQNLSKWGTTVQQMGTQDVRTISSPATSQFAYHDGSGGNTEGPAFYDSNGDWRSVVDGSIIS